MNNKYVNTIKNFQDILPTRREIINSASSEFDPYDPMAELAKRLHPDNVSLIIDEVIDETADVKTFKLVPNQNSDTKELPVFKAGQYISVKIVVDGSPITRAYSLSSSPEDALKNNFYTLTIKKTDGGFLTSYIWNNWNEGTEIESSAPLGFFHYEHLRDTKDMVGLCGGSGVTPMHSMIRQIVQKNLDFNFTLFYGIKHENEIVFKDEFAKLEAESNGKIKIIYVCSDPDACWKGATGFLSADLIKKYIDIEGKTFFICGPGVMYKYLDGELPKLNIQRRRIRREVFGETPDITRFEDYPQEMKDKTFNIIVNVGKGYKKISAKATDTILVSLEKAGIAAPSHCRSGECGYCRSRLIDGQVYVKKDSDGRRIGDLIYGYIHPCSTYPISDMEIEIPMIER
jgi:ferredoxin-NADP reductase